MTIVDSRSVLLADLIQGRRFDVPEIQRAYAFAIDNSDDAEANAAFYATVPELPVLLSRYRKVEAELKEAVQTAIETELPMQITTAAEHARAMRGVLGSQEFNDWLTDVAVERTPELLHDL